MGTSNEKLAIMAPQPPARGNEPFRGFPANVFAGATALACAKKMQPSAPIIDRDRQAPRRTKIWEMSGSLHCSIIGTCLTTAELRSLVRKFMVTAKEHPSDHDYNGIAVSAVGKHDTLAKQIQKALDRQHKAAIVRFGAADSGAEVLGVWTESVKSGDIPGAYWAALTHPKSDDTVVRKVFGEVHMLSHLVGAANRADIRRLHQLEEDNTALTEKSTRQERHLCEGLIARDEKIASLSALLSARIERDESSDLVQNHRSDNVAALERLIADLRKQLDGEIVRRQRAEAKVESLTAARAEENRTIRGLERNLLLLSQELETAETHLVPTEAARLETDDWSLAGETVLYIGGRAHLIPRLRALIEDASGCFLHHDGGIDERADLLSGLISRADIAVFPVDCISHAGMLLVKKLCRQFGKPFVPLRSSGVSSLLNGLKSRHGDSAFSTAAE